MRITPNQFILITIFIVVPLSAAAEPIFPHTQSEWASALGAPAPVSSRRHTKNILIGNTSSQSAETAPSRAAAKVQFAFDSATVQAEANPDLDNLGAALTQELKAAVLVIEGHTDQQGTEAYNMWLSVQRAAAVRKYLITKFAIEADRLSIVGYGEQRPLVEQYNAAEQAKNRRVEFRRLK